jgi:hypothetical protein
MDTLAAVQMRQARKAGKTARQLAAEYGVDVSHVYGVLRGDSYAPQITVYVDDATYLAFHHSAKKARKTISEHASEILKERVK